MNSQAMTDISSSEWITQDDEDELKKIYAKDGVKAGVAYLQNKCEKWKEISVNVGVIGEWGIGKFLFLSRKWFSWQNPMIRAPIRATDGTSELLGFVQSNNKKIWIVDLPDVGVPFFTQDIYLKKINLNAYDCFVLITSTKFRETDFCLAQQIIELDKRLYVLCYHITQDGVNGSDYNQEKVQETVRCDITNKLKNFDVGRVFFTDDKKYDYDDLEIAIINELPVPKRHAMILTLAAKTEKMIKMKVQELRTRCAYKTLAISGIKFLPLEAWFRANHLKTLTDELSFYSQQLGINDDSLERLAVINKCDLKSLKEILSRCLPHGFGTDMIKKLFDSADYERNCSEYFLAKIKDYHSWIPEGIVDDPLTMFFPMYAMHHALNNMEKAALELLSHTGSISL